MQDMVINAEIAGVDFSKITALQQKRTLAFINHFLITTVQFLNNFANTCEEKLMHLERKLERINASMVLLEAKLSSIPEVNTLEVSNTQAHSNEKSKENIGESAIEVNKEIVAECEQNELIDDVCQKKKQEYERFLKMIQVGVPLEAVKLKISLEGLDPNELEKILRK